MEAMNYTNNHTHTQNIQNEGEFSMRNISFNDMKAMDIVGKVLEQEKAFAEKDFSALSFEEKCEYALAHVHSSTPFAVRLSQNDLSALKGDIMERAIDGDAVALYYLAKLSTTFGFTEERKLAWLKRASDKGYLPATVFYLRLCRDKEERYAIARQLVSKIPSIQPLKVRALAIISCYSTLRRVEGEDKYPHHHTLTYDLFLALAKEGDANAYTWLETIASRKAKHAQTEAEKQQATEEAAFWQAVQFLVAEHYYAKGNLKHEEHLGYMLLQGIGCEVDVERGAALTLQSMQRKAATLEEKVAKRVRASFTREGKALTLGDELILAILDGNGEALSQCISAAKASDDFARILSGASSLLSVRVYDAKKEVKDEV